MRTLVAHASVYGVASAVQIVSAVVVIPVITRLLPASGYGLVATALLVIQVVALVGGLGLQAAVIRVFYLPGRGPAGARMLVSWSIIAVLVVAGVADVAGPLWTGALFSDVPYDGPIRIAVWLGAALTVVTGCQAFLQAEGRPSVFALLAVTNATGGQLLGLGSLLLLGATPSMYLAGMLVGTLAAGAIGLASVRPRLPDRDAMSVLAEGLAIGLPTVPHSLALQVLALGDRIIIERSLGLAAVGRYQVAYVVGTAGVYLLGAANNAWAPLVYREPEARRWRTLANSTRFIETGAAVTTVAVTMLAPVGLALLAPASYERGPLAAIAAVSALTMVPFVRYLANVHVLFDQARTLPLAVVTPVAAATNIGLNLVLIPRFGLTGAAAATVLAFGLQWAGVAAVARWTVRVPWHPRSTARLLGIGVVAAGGAVLLPATSSGLVVRASLVAGAVVVGVRSLRRQLRTEMSLS